MRVGNRALGFLVIALAVARCAAAEPLGSHAEFSPMIGKRFEKGSNAAASNWYGGVRIDLYGNRWLGFEASAGMVPIDNRTRGAFLGFTHLAGSVIVSPLMWRGGGAYVFAGAGETQRDIGNKFAAEFGGGGIVWLSDALGLRVEARGLSATSGIGNLLVMSAGLTRTIGGNERDADHDGVPDHRDREPNTAKGAEVDAFGVTKDDDGDHVPNGIDRDNHTPHGALVDQWGVAHDADHDGVYDGLDKCPDTPVGATVDATGCPQDQDKDSVFDGLDKCKDTPAGATVDATGCPQDQDKDGVFDGLDKCPDTPAGTKVDATGCGVTPTPEQRKQEMIDTGKISSTLIHFDTGRSDLLPESNADLDAIGQVLSQVAAIRIEVGGHCDIRGSDALNEKLSAERARAVVDYLVQHFPALTRERLSSRGYGRSQPVAPNTSPEGMALNRRVVFKVLNPEALKP